MAEVPAQPQPQVTMTPKSTNWKKVALTIVFILVAAGIVVGIYWFMVVNKSSEDSDLTGPVPKVTTKASTESAKSSTKSAKELLKQQLSEEEIEKIENEEADQNAESNTVQIATAVSACTTTLLSQGTASKDIYSTTDGCGDFSFLVNSGYATEIPDDPKPVIKTDPLNSVICIWAKGGSIDQNHWSFFATDNAKISLGNGGSKQITAGSVSVLNLKSNPIGCQKI